MFFLNTNQIRIHKVHYLLNTLKILTTMSFANQDLNDEVKKPFFNLQHFLNIIQLLI
jgi:hypothetical protein